MAESDLREHKAAVLLFAENFGFTDWSAAYVVALSSELARYAPVVVKAAVLKLCRESLARPWNPLAALLAACDAEDAARTLRLAPPPKVLPCIPGASMAEVAPYARSATEPFTHADLLRIRDEIAAARERKPTAQRRWRPPTVVRTEPTEAMEAEAKRVTEELRHRRDQADKSAVGDETEGGA